MQHLYSAQTSGFYLAGVHANIPADAVPISAERHQELIDAQAAGAAIVATDEGVPAIVQPGAPTLAQRRATKIQETKREAERRILTVAPLWRQSNDAAAIAGMALQLATADATTIDASAALARRAAIDALRDASNAIEGQIAGMTAIALSAFDVTADAHWPELGEEAA